MATTILSRKLITAGLFVCFLFFFICFCVSLRPNIPGAGGDIYQKNKPVINDEEFDASLLRLNSFGKLSNYVDSLFQRSDKLKTYPDIVFETICKRFYHGYCLYSAESNPLGVLMEPIVKNGAVAVVIPEDIIKYEYAACSQQSIVAMELCKRKGFSVRKVTMFDTVMKIGHFAFEVFYKGGWHFFDTDQEPDMKVLAKYQHPSSAFLAANPDIALNAYRLRKNPELFKRLLQSSKTGVTNKFPAPTAYFFQKLTKYLSYFGWIFFLSIIALRYKLGKTKSRPRVLKPVFEQSRIPAMS